MTREHDTLRRLLSRSAKRMPTAAKQLFRQFLAELSPAPLGDRSDGRRKHSWHRKSKPRRSKRRTIVKPDLQPDLFTPTPETRNA